MRHIPTLLAAAALTCLSAAALADETTTAAAPKVDNPRYTAWAKFKPGTLVKTRTENEMPGMQGLRLANGAELKVEQTLTLKLIEVTPEKVVLESMATKQNVANDVKTMKPETLTIPAKIDKEKADLISAGLPEAKVELKNVVIGTDTIEVAGMKFEAATREMDVELAAPPETRPGMMSSPRQSHVKVWTSAEMPGGVIKTVTTRDRPMRTSITTTVVELKIAE